MVLCLTHTKNLEQYLPQECLNPDCQDDNTHETENCPWIKCKHCNKLGHSKPDCPDYKCSICFKNGHLEEQHHLYCAVCDEDYKHATNDCPRVMTLQETYLTNYFFIAVSLHFSCPNFVKSEILTFSKYVIFRPFLIS